MTIEIPDKKLRYGLEKVINPPSLRKQELNKETLKNIRYLNLNNRNIINLEGIKWCEKLEVLYLADNSFEDISPLERLPKLQLLDLSMNPQIHWMSLSRPLYTVERLFLRSCELPNDLILKYFPNIRQVSLFHNQITQIEYLYDLQHLDSVDLLHNPIPAVELEVFYNQTGVGIMEKKQRI